jgi:hypothetical protein
VREVAGGGVCCDWRAAVLQRMKSELAASGVGGWWSMLLIGPAQPGMPAGLSNF